MNLYSGNGFPFFFTKFESPYEKKGPVAGFAYKMHKYGGVAFEYLVAIHVGAVVFNHMIKRQPVLHRMTGGSIIPLLVLPYMGLAAGVAYCVEPNELPDPPKALPKFN